MPGTFLGYPFDEELFSLNWQNEEETTLTAMLQSGAIQRNGEIQRLIANGSNQYTIPIYDIIGGEPDNYDGTSNITTTTPKGHYQTGVVYGRAHSWKDQDFVHDFNSGANPMKQISSQVAKYWQKKRQAIMLKILAGAFDTTDNVGGYLSEWKTHTYNIATKTASVAAENRMGATTAGDAIQKAVGDNSGVFGMAWMHSKVANNLAGLDLLEFRKYTDERGIQRTLQIADYNGLTVIVDDGAPAAQSSSASGSMEYTTYLLGTGAIQYASAPVTKASELGREALKEGGYNYLVTRMRETLHPNGFSFALPGETISPTDVQLGTSANWKISNKPKSIALARIITNG